MRPPLPIFKIPLLLTSAYLAHLASIPPNPPPKSTERAKYGKKADFLSSNVLLYWYTSVYWIHAIGESVLILAPSLPSPLSSPILSLLANGDRASASQVGFTSTWLIGWSLMLTGSLIRLWCYRLLGHAFTFDLAIQHDQRLVTHGPYAVVRHPSYTACLILVAGVILCLFGSGSWLATCGGAASAVVRAFAMVWCAWMGSGFLVMVLRRTGIEDKVLQGQFGKRWDEYARETPYRLVPFVY